jgi:hypothetical protein
MTVIGPCSLCGVSPARIILWRAFFRPHFDFSNLEAVIQFKLSQRFKNSSDHDENR